MRNPPNPPTGAFQQVIRYAALVGLCAGDAHQVALSRFPRSSPCGLARRAQRDAGYEKRCPPPAVLAVRVAMVGLRPTIKPTTWRVCDLRQC